jgi:hypothetical protein
MAIINNRVTAIGDVLFIKTDVPIIGVITLLSFIDSTVGEDSGKFFNKTFRYSLDGVNYTDFQNLTIENISGININVTDTLFIEYLYGRSGTSTSGELVFNYVQLNGEINLPTPGRAWNESNFSSYLTYNNLCSISWSVNVLEKLYKKGQLAEFIERGKSNNTDEDRDFIDFWRAVTHYYALFVCLSRYFKDFWRDPNLLAEFLTQRGLILSRDETYTELLYLMNYFYDEIRQRGTIQIIKRKDFADYLTIPENSVSLSNSQSYSASNSSYEQVIDIKDINGEYLRLIKNHKYDGFIFNLNKNEHIGWHVDRSSPLYRGLRNRLNCNQFNVDEFFHLTDVLIKKPQYCSIVNDNRGPGVLRITQNGPESDRAGLGGYVFGENFKKYGIVVNTHLDYELSFWIKHTGDSTLGCINVGIQPRNQTENTLASCKKVITNVNSNNFMTNINLPSKDRYYYVSCILHRFNAIPTYSVSNTYKQGDYVKVSTFILKAKRSVPAGISILNATYWKLLSSIESTPIRQPNIGIGDNLQFGVKQNVVVFPFIELTYREPTSSNKLFIHSVRFQPLSTPYSKGFVQTKNFLEIWNTNNNQSLSNQEVDDFTKRYLIPYNTVLQNNFAESCL